MSRRWCNFLFPFSTFLSGGDEKVLVTIKFPFKIQVGKNLIECSPNDHLEEQPKLRDLQPGQKEEVNFTCQLPNVVNIEERRGRGLSKSKSGSRSRSFPSFPSFGSASFGYLQSQYTPMCRSKCRNQGFHPFFSPSEAVRCTNKCVLDEMKKAEHEQVLEIYRVSHNIGSTLFFAILLYQNTKVRWVLKKFSKFATW